MHLLSALRSQTLSFDVLNHDCKRLGRTCDIIEALLRFDFFISTMVLWLCTGVLLQAGWVAGIYCVIDSLMFSVSSKGWIGSHE